MVFAIDCGCGWPGWRGLEPGRAPRSGRYLRRQGKRRSCEASFPYAPPSPRSSSSPLLFDGDAMSGGCGSLPVVAVRDSPRSRHAQRPAHRCRRRAAHAGSVAALSAALAAASTESVAPLSRGLVEDAAGPPARARTGASDSCSRPTPTPRRRARAPASSPRSASAPVSRVRRTCRSRSQSSRRRRRLAAVCAEGGAPEARDDAVVGAACLAEAAACGAAFVKFAGLLNGRGAEFANAAAGARDRPLAR